MALGRVFLRCHESCTIKKNRYFIVIIMIMKSGKISSLSLMLYNLTTLKKIQLYYYHYISKTYNKLNKYDRLLQYI